MVAVLSGATSPTILLPQCLKVILGFQTLWPSVLSHVNFDLKKLLPGQQEMNFPPISQQLTLQILLQAPAGTLKWYQQVSFNQYNTSQSNKLVVIVLLDSNDHPILW